MLPGNAWLDLLRKSAQHPLVIAAMADLGSPEIKTEKHGEYRYWRDKSVTLYFERDRLTRLSFWKNVPSFSGPLPYGISLEWTRTELHRKLGVPTKSDELFSVYEFSDDMVRLSVFFGMERGQAINNVTFRPLEDPIVIY